MVLEPPGVLAEALQIDCDHTCIAMEILPRNLEPQAETRYFGQLLLGY